LTWGHLSLKRTSPQGEPAESAGGSPDDAFLVGRARSGDAGAFEALVRRHYRAAYALALALVGNAMDAEDVCQDAFVKALDRLEDCRHPDRFRGWFMRIVRNRAHNVREYQHLRVTEPLEGSVAAAAAKTEDPAERAELRGELEKALQTVSVIQRQVVLLHDLEGWKHREIAEFLGVSEETSRQHLFVARKRLREVLGKEIQKDYRR
jgi:RNA polymerase sigma-70 factor, ECF subfamily